MLCLRTSSLKGDATDGGTFLAQFTAIWSGWPGKEQALLGWCSPGKKLSLTEEPFVTWPLGNGLTQNPWQQERQIFSYGSWRLVKADW